MPKYLFEGSYTSDGIRGIVSEGGTARRQVVEAMTVKLGGKVESFYYAFGGADVYVIVDLPDDTSAAAIALAVNASGRVALKTTVLLTPEEIDAAAKTVVDYRPPG
jgi:uncharacterized protein with GYD domain